MKSTFSPALLLVLIACGEKPAPTPVTEGPPPAAPGEPILIDGSSTVFPISEAVAEEFQKKYPGRRVTVGTSGTGGGFKKFCAKEIAISDASRPIKKSEAEACAANGVKFIELPVAYDGLAVVVNPKNTWVDQLTTAELKALWAPEAQDKIKTWDQVRKGFPKEEIHLFGPGVDSGTYDYFTQAIVGKEHSSRGDYTGSEDDNVLVQGISTDTNALGFFGLAYYEENAAKLKLVPIDDGNAENGAGPIAPSAATVLDGTYQPLSRPLFIYVSVAAAERPEVADFITYYLAEGKTLVREAGYVPLPDAVGPLAVQRFAERKAGSVFINGGSQVGMTPEKLLSSETVEATAPAPEPATADGTDAAATGK